MKQNIKKHFDKISQKRDRFIKRNRYYYKDLYRFFNFNVLPDSSILEIGCGSGNLLNALKPSRGVGIDISGEMIKKAKDNYSHLSFIEADGEGFDLNETFDYIIISDTLGYFVDIQKVFQQIKKHSHSSTRLILTFHNYLWSPINAIAEGLRMKMPRVQINWLNEIDVSNILELEEFDVIKRGKRMLFPKMIPGLSWILNKYIANLPLFNRLCLTGFIVARPQVKPELKLDRVSVVIPAMNESGNIENAIKRLPQMGKSTEIIFIEGGSADDTWDEINRVAEKYKDSHEIKIGQQDGKGKGDAVRKGYDMATGDVLMILDADLTVPPEDLPKFYHAIASGKGEYINGSRLVYPMEDEAMRPLNILGNKFFSVMFSWILNQRLKDTLCGTKVMTRENWDKIQKGRSYFGDFDPFGDFDMIFGSAKLNLKFIEVPIRYQAREYGDTNISRFKHGFLLLRMMFFAMNKIKFQ